MAASGWGDLSMRYRLMATYRGVPYEAGIGPTDADVVLFAACPPPEELGFEPATGHWRKELRIEEVQALWQSRPMGTFRGDRCIVLDDLGDRLHIAYLGHDAYQAEQLGYWQVDRGVFELITPRDEVTEIVEERLDYSRAGGTGPRATGPHATVPPVTGPHATVPPVTGPHATVPPVTGPHATGPHATVPPVTGPHATVPPVTGPHAAVPPVTGPHATGPHATVPPVTGPHATVPPVTGPHATAPVTTRAAAPRDLAVIPEGGEPPLPLEAAARRAALARVMQPTGPPAAEPAPPFAPDLGLTAMQPGPPAAQPTPPAAQPAPPGPERLRPPARRRRSAVRRQATQRIFSELASLAAIPPSAYAVGEEVDGAMCLIQTADGFEVFNAAAGARHEVRIFDDEESAYFYLFGVLAAEAIRTGRLAPHG
jgi:hypothetical protein